MIDPPSSPKKEIKVEADSQEVNPLKPPEKVSKKDRKKEKKEPKDKIEKKELHKGGKDKKEHKKKNDTSKSVPDEGPLKKGLQPLPTQYPPPKPSSAVPKSDEPHRRHHHKKKHEIEVPPSIKFPVDDDDDNSEEEKKPSFLPSTIGGVKKNDFGDLSHDVEDLGMESAHGTALMSLPRTHGIHCGLRKNDIVSDGSGSIKSKRKRKGRGHKHGESDNTSGPAEWDAVLGPTDCTGRPEIHRGMSVASLHPLENEDEDSILPETSLLAPKKSFLGTQPELAEEDAEQDDASVIPLTPSQIRAQQKPTQKPSTKTSPEYEDDSNRTSPTVSSTVEDDNADKSPNCKNENLKPSRGHPKHSPFKKRGNQSSKLQVTPSPDNAPLLEIGIPEELAEKTRPKHSEVHSRNHPKYASPSTRKNGSSGLKDYSKKKNDEDSTPSRVKSGLKDYSKRAGDRSLNISNTPIGTEIDINKDKHNFMDDGKSVGSNDLVRKPKKELKISMKTKEPEISVPPTITETPRAPEKKRSKEKKSNKAKRPVPLTEEEKVLMRKKCYMWYARMGQPDRENMKRRVAALPAHCNMYVEDVDLLPWICYGTVLSVKAMNELFMGDDAE